jgi:signal transduction histidine kinase
LSDRKDEKIDARLSEFLYELRHEVYTPLSVIKGYTELIGEKLVDMKDPEIKKYL